MSITVLEATKLESFRNFKLIAGHRGLDNTLETIGILDYEFITKIKGQFIKGEFVISSLLFAKDNPDFILEAVKGLVEDGVCGLAIKNVYYNELPAEVVLYANEKSFPLFIFDNSVFFEEIITDVMDKLRAVDNYEILETKVNILINKNLNRSTVREIALEINSSFKEHFFVLYFREKRYAGKDKIFTTLDRLKRKKSMDSHSSAIHYRNGILVIFTKDGLLQRELGGIASYLVESLGIDIEEYHVGIGSLHANLSELDSGIKESIYAHRAGEVSNHCINHFDNIGIYSILMPYLDEIWMHGFYSRIITPIKGYDEKYNSELFDTAVKYIENDGKINETAKALFLHKNTIRYRISKIKELLDMENSEGSFYEQLSIAIKLDKIYNC